MTLQGDSREGQKLRDPRHPCGWCNSPDALPRRVRGLRTFICGDCWAILGPNDKYAVALSDPWRRFPEGVAKEETDR